MTDFNRSDEAQEIFKAKRKPKGPIKFNIPLNEEQKRAKEHKVMIEALKRGDKIITSGGIIAKVSKVIDDNEVEVEIAPDVKIKVVRSTISQVQGKPTPANDDKK